MRVEQISIFLENTSGRLAAVTRILADAGVNIRSLSLADTADFGVLRLIVDRTDQAQQVLKDNGFTVGKTDVIAVEMSDKPGGLHHVVEVLDREDLNIEYMYAFVQKKGGNAIVVFKITDAERAVEALKASGIPILAEDIVQNL